MGVATSSLEKENARPDDVTIFLALYDRERYNYNQTVSKCITLNSHP